MSENQHNELASFRAPKWWSKQTGYSHFQVKRGDISNDTEGLTSIYPGEFTYKNDPTLEIDLAIWEDNDHPKSISTYYRMTGTEGFQPCMAEEWEVADRIKLAWLKDDSGRLTLQGRTKNTLVVMWRTGEEYDKAQKRRLARSDEIQKTPEEKEAEMQEKFGSLGATVRVTVQDDEGRPEEAVMPRRGRPRKRG